MAGRLATGYFFSGEPERAADKADFAIELSERLGDPEGLARGFAVMAMIVAGERPEEATAQHRQSLAISSEHGLFDHEYNALFNLSDISFQRDRYDDALGYLDGALAIARRRGSRSGEWGVLSEITYPLFMQGRWDEAVERSREVPEERLLEALTLSLLSGVLEIRLRRGEVTEARELLSHYEPYRESGDMQNRGCVLAASACLARAEGRFDEAVRDGMEAVGLSRAARNEGSQMLKQGLVETVPPGLRSGYLDAQAMRFRGRLSESSEDGAERLTAATARFRELVIPFWLGVTLLEHAELTGEDASFAEAREIFEDLRATPWLERAAAAGGRAAVPA